MLPEKDAFLRQRTSRIKNISHKTEELRQNFLDTWDTVQAYGIAAPQIGSNLRAFIWKGDKLAAPEVIFNPKIIRARGELTDYDGCLSVPGIYGRTRRAEVVEITAWNEKGQPIRRTFEGFDARIVQHEIDHLEGVLFIDRIDAVDDLYTLKEDKDEKGDPVYVEEPLTEGLKNFVEQFRRPLPGHALIW